jgi:hypothetical protein
MSTYPDRYGNPDTYYDDFVFKCPLCSHEREEDDDYCEDHMLAHGLTTAAERRATRYNNMLDTLLKGTPQ